MGRDRIFNAVARLERALDRAEEGASKAQGVVSVGPNPALLRRHEHLRRTVTDAMSDLDALIESLDK
ncbi:MAG: hypothetical protein AB7U34_03465 [Novosphingobium sp.]